MGNTPVPLEEKKGLIKDDRLLVCGMLALYGLCFIGVIGAAFLWLDQAQDTRNASATSTEAAIATEQANAAATAVTRVTEQAQYDFLDRFDDDSGRWYEGNESGDYGKFSAYIANGIYTWNIIDPNAYTQGTDFYQGSSIKDFDAYVDIEFVKSPDSGIACSGLAFRKSSLGWEDGAYTFTICDDSSYWVSYYQTGEWKNITNASLNDSLHPADWNRIEVHATGNGFTFYINNAMVYEMTDDRRKSGGLGLYIEVDDNKSAVIHFDNFGFQRR